MAATLKDISNWYDEGVRLNKDFMIVVCDQFDWGGYPVYCTKSDFEDQFKCHKAASMQKVMEVYNLSMNKDEQLKAKWAYNVPASEAMPLKERTHTLDQLQLETLKLISKLREQFSRLPHEAGLSDDEFLEQVVEPLETKIQQDRHL